MLQPSIKTLQREHIAWLDLLRLVAIFMVICVHSTDPFNVSPAARMNPDYNFWGSIFGSMLRPRVPLFVMITGLLLLPVQQEMGVFYKRRISRVLFPFLIWSVLYNLFPWITGILGLSPQFITGFFAYAGNSPSQALSDSLRNIALIPLNFSVYATHMWYIYMLIGLYLYLPIFSAWVEKASERAKLTFLILWGITLFIPYIQQYFSANLLGTCSWNAYGTFSAFAGFNGYLLLGHYLSKGNKLTLLQTLLINIPLFAIGYAITFIGFRAITANPAATEPMVELFFTYCSINVLMMTLAVFMIIRKIKISSAFLVRHLGKLTKFGFGIYMVHYFFVGPCYMLAAQLNIPIAFRIPFTAVFALAISWTMVALIYRLPKAKWIMG